MSHPPDSLNVEAAGEPAGLDLVTGGSGLTGRALVAQLQRAGRRVRVLDLLPSLDPDVESVIGDIRDVAVVARAMAGVHTVYHTVAVVTQHPAKTALVDAVNVGGTDVLIRAAQQAGVTGFVFTSSIDVVFDGSDIAAGDESLPYPATFLDAYGRSKAEAERLVLAANGQHGMATVSLRAAGIFGPHDQHRLPVALRHIRKNGYVPMGDGSARFSHVYVDNLAHAHVLAGARLSLESPHAGKAYFITDHAPSNFFTFLEPYLAEVGIGPARMRLPRRLAWGLGCVMEATYHTFGRFISVDPVLTRYTVAAVCRDFWFVHDAATRDFGYEPIVSAEEAYDRTARWFIDAHGPGATAAGGASATIVGKARPVASGPR